MSLSVQILIFPPPQLGQGAPLTGRHWTNLLEKVLFPDPGKPTKTSTRGAIV